MNRDLHIDHLLDEYTAGSITRDWLQKQVPALNEQELEKEIQLHRAAQSFLERAPIIAQVGILHEQFLNENNSIHADKKLIWMGRLKWIGMAASLLLAVGIYFWQSGNTLNADQLYAEVYQPYQAPVFRSQEKAADLTALFKKGAYQELVTAYEATKPVDNSAHFYAGLSYMELKNWTAASLSFQRILDNTASPAFRDEAQFYGALTYLKTGALDKSVELFRDIKQDQQHLYFEKVQADQLEDLEALLRKK